MVSCYSVIFIYTCDCMRGLERERLFVLKAKIYWTKPIDHANVEIFKNVLVCIIYNDCLATEECDERLKIKDANMESKTRTSPIFVQTVVSLDSSPTISRVFN